LGSHSNDTLLNKILIDKIKFEIIFFVDFLIDIMSQTSSFPYFGNTGQFRADGKPAVNNKFNLKTLFDFSTL
jgi:hypothetical protein